MGGGMSPHSLSLPRSKIFKIRPSPAYLEKKGGQNMKIDTKISLHAALQSRNWARPLFPAQKKGEKGGQKKCVGDGGGRVVELL